MDGRQVFSQVVMKKEFPDPDLKHLLLDIESTGFDLDTVDIQKVLSADPDFYGAPNSKKKKAFSRKFYQLRRTSLESYSEYDAHVFCGGRALRD